jgi:hypothetical protein
MKIAAVAQIFPQKSYASIVALCKWLWLHFGRFFQKNLNLVTLIQFNLVGLIQSFINPLSGRDCGNVNKCLRRFIGAKSFGPKMSLEMFILKSVFQAFYFIKHIHTMIM